jgi:hypothetical protein
VRGCATSVGELARLTYGLPVRADAYDFLSDGSFPFGALRLGRDLGRVLVVEGGDATDVEFGGGLGFRF